MSFKISFTDLHHSDLLTECHHISTSTKHDFNVLSKSLSLRDFILFAVLSVTKKSFNYIVIVLCEYGTGEKKQNNKNKAMKFPLITCGEQSFPRKHRNCGKISMGVHPFHLRLKKMVKTKALFRAQSAIFYQYVNVQLFRNFEHLT